MPDSLSQVLGRIGGTQRIVVLLVGVGALAVIWGFSHWGMQPNYVPIATDLPLDRIGEATQSLDQAGIAYRLDRGGSVISVDENSAGKARVTLAAAGLTGSSDRPGFELFDKPSWGMTDFTQRVNYRRALEGELEHTIGHMRGVQGAQVQLTLQDPSFLKASKRPPQASVVLDRAPSAVTDEAFVEGIQALVASAVDGMTPQNVTVLDDRGRLLSSAEGDAGVGLSNRQLQVQRQVESYLQSKADALVQQMVGNGNSSVRVSAQLNFDQIDRTVEGVNPDQQALVSENRSEITPGQPSQGASSVTTNDVYQNTRSTETVSRGGAQLERLTVAVVLADKEVKAANGTMTYQPRTPAEIRQVEAVVRNAVGFSAKRGDQISVVSAPFPKKPLPKPEPGPGFADMLLTYQRPIVALLGLLVAFLLVGRVLRTLASVAPKSSGKSGGALSTAPATSELSFRQPATQLSPAEMPAAPALADPAMTARVVRAWMKES